MSVLTVREPKNVRRFRNLIYNTAAKALAALLLYLELNIIILGPD